MPVLRLSLKPNFKRLTYKDVVQKKNRWLILKKPLTYNDKYTIHRYTYTS